MSTATCIHELRPYKILVDPKLSKEEKLQAITEYVNHWLELLKDWATVAKLCIEVRDNKLWKYGPFTCYQDWISSFEGFSERKLRSVVNLFEALKDDFSTEEMNSIPPETAKVVKKISKAARRDPVVRNATKQKREKFIKTLAQVRPDEHIEPNITRTFTYEASQWEKIQQAMEMYRRIQNPNASEAEILECWAVDYLIENTQAMGAEA